MRLIATLKSVLFASASPTQLGLYGPPNAGKTTLANRIAADWADVTVGDASRLPHETQAAQRAEDVTIEREESTVTVDVVDTPGVTTEVDHADFLEHGLDETTARERARTATAGIGEAMRVLREDVGGVLYVVDAAADPYAQVNSMLVGIAEDQSLPLVVVANKIDDADADVDRVVEAFPDRTVVPVSGLTGENVDELYEAIVEAFGS